VAAWDVADVAARVAAWDAARVAARVAWDAACVTEYELQVLDALSVINVQGNSNVREQIAALKEERDKAITEIQKMVAESELWDGEPQATIAELRAEIGTAPEGSHPDEQKPRDRTWHQERLNWQGECDARGQAYLAKVADNLRQAGVIAALKCELIGEKEWSEKWSETLHGHLLAQIGENKKMLLSFQEHFAALKGRKAEEIKRLQRKHHPVCSCKQCMGLKEDPPDALKQEEVKDNG
jgi:hypothetical protein